MIRFFHMIGALSLLAATGQLQAESPPDWMKHITRLPPGDNANLRAVELKYTLAWNNRVNAAQVQVSINRTKDGSERFVADAKGKSTGFARVLFPYDFEARSIVNADSLRPIDFNISEKDRKERSTYHILFGKNEQVFTTTSQKEGQAARSATNRFSFDYGQDVLSAAFYLRSQPLKKGDEVAMLVTPFNRPYVAKFVVTGRETRKIKGKRYPVIKLDAKIGKVNSDLSLKQYERAKKITLWVSDDEYRIPLELQADIGIGFVSARIDGLKWLE